MKRPVLFTALFFFSWFSAGVALQAQGDTVDILVWRSTSRTAPTIDIFAGEGRPRLGDEEALSLGGPTSFTYTNSFELRLGHATRDLAAKYVSNGLLKYDQTFLSLSRQMYKEVEHANTLNASFWSFGIGNQRGLGYRAGENFDIILNSGRGVKWTQMTAEGYTDIEPLLVSNQLGRYQDKFKFGDSWEAQIKLDYSSVISLNLSYGQTIVMPAFVFWPWLGSSIIHGAASGILSNFLMEISESTPSVGPIMHFILTNALSAGMYALRSKDMNWPFGYDDPLMIDEFKVGLGFSF